MNEYIKELSAREEEELRKTIRELLRQSCILETKYDAAKGTLKDNPRYGFCMRHREFLTDYFQVMGLELVYDPQDHFFRLTGQGAGSERFGETSTLLVLLMKLIYRDKILGKGLKATVTNLEEIRRYGSETGILTRKLTEREVAEALSLMKTHQMIELPCAIADVEDGTPIYLYHTINVFCSGAAIGQLCRKYGVKEEADENA